MRQHGMGLFIELLDFEPGCEEGVRVWLDDEHMRRTLLIPGVCGGASYEAIHGGPRFVNLYEGESAQSFYTQAFLSRNGASSRREREVTMRRTVEMRLLCAQIYPPYPFSEPLCPTVEVAGLAPVILLARMSPPPERMADLHAWYTQDRVPRLEKVPGVVRVRRYVAVEGQPTLVALYEMEAEDVIEGSAWKRAISRRSRLVRDYFRQNPEAVSMYRRRGFAH